MNDLIRSQLEECKDFKEFFIKVSKIKVTSDIEDLRKLQKIVTDFIPIYGGEAIIYLNDCISTEAVLPCKSKEVYKTKEKQMQKEIVDNFSVVFPKFKFLKTEKVIDGIGRIDIFAKSEEQFVVIELKAERKNPNKQLIAYGSEFDNPILIGITEEPFPENKKIQGIQYFSFNELKKEAEIWIF